MMTRSLHAWAAALCLALANAGCIVDDDPDVVVIEPERTGLLTTFWTIEGSVAPTACFAYNAYDFELVVYDDLGYFFTEVQVPCQDFGVSAELPAGFYSADVTLVDNADFAVTFTQVLYDLAIVAGQELVVDVNFGPDSVLFSSN